MNENRDSIMRMARGAFEERVDCHRDLDLPALVVRRQLDGEGDLALGGGLGVGVEDVLDHLVHLVVDALLEGAPSPGSRPTSTAQSPSASAASTASAS